MIRAANRLREPNRGMGFRTGLTLIEVLLALAILLIALAGIGQLVNIGTDHANEARMHARGTRFAQLKLAEVEAGVIPIDGAAGQGGTFDDDSAWSWTLSPVPAGPPNLYTVTVTVTRDNRGTPFTVTLSQMMLDPAAVGSAAQAEMPPASDTDGMGGTSP